MKIQYLGICLFLIIAHFFITDYKNTYVKEEDNTRKEFYMNVEKGIQVLFAVTVIIGIVTYYLKQRADYGAQFDLVKFFFGTPQCKFSP
jgi:cellobiose-specific phosphotransferase system component IIC